VLNRDEKHRVDCFHVGQLVRAVAETVEASFALPTPLLQHVRWGPPAFSDRLCQALAARRSQPSVPQRLRLTAYEHRPPSQLPLSFS
jgi:hypothetical protein